MVKPEIDLSKIDSHKRRQFFIKEDIEYLGGKNRHFNIKIENIIVKALREYCG